MDLATLATLVLEVGNLAGVGFVSWVFWPYFRAATKQRFAERRLRRLGKVAEADELLKLLRGGL